MPSHNAEAQPAIASYACFAFAVTHKETIALVIGIFDLHLNEHGQRQLFAIIMLI